MCDKDSPGRLLHKISAFRSSSESKFAEMGILIHCQDRRSFFFTMYLNLGSRMCLGGRRAEWAPEGPSEGLGFCPEIPEFAKTLALRYKLM